MIKYVCDWCSRVKRSEEVWILGHAAEALGVTSARREVTILSSWDEELAVAPLAVHFCSLECKGKFLGQLFKPDVTTRDAVLQPSTSSVVVPKRSRKEATKARSRKSHQHRRAS